MKPSYWTIRAKPIDGRWVDLRLPCVVGSSPKSDIVIHSPALNETAKVLIENQGRLVSWDPISRTYSNEPDLSAYGIQIRGPFFVGGRLSSRISWYARRLDRALLRNIPVRFQDAVGGHFGIKGRWAWLTLVCLGICLNILAYLRSAPSYARDLSRKTIAVPYGEVSSIAIGYRSQDSSYRYGATLSFPVPESARGHQHIFEFSLAGADKATEIQIISDAKTLFTSQVDPDCIEQLCRHSVLLPGALTQVETVNLIVAHRRPTSPYLMTGMLFDRLRPLDMQERKSLERRLDLAQRMYDERAVSYINLIHAQKNVAKVLDTIRLRSAVEDLRVTAEALQADLAVEINSQTEDMWFQSRRALHLGEYTEAIQHLRGLLEFYPDPTHPRHIQISSVIQKLEGML